ncbi:DUF1493 family protein [Bacteroides sp. 519]|uniref:DUF1493 family protein n=1 Tax=Bacteroides sp. 519 TaxID=2302937 RepID=UPI0013D4A009|nr:DUF1493 family protein [Bacteroides sp. 519]
MGTELSKITAFIINFNPLYQSYQIDLETKIEEDLGITGDDAYELIVTYGEYFNIDVSHFNLSDYFKDEGYDIISPILELFKLKKTKIKKVLTIRGLIKGIKHGRLNDEIISMKD